MNDLKFEPGLMKEKKQYVTLDSIDEPDCFGEFSKKDKLCVKYCAMSIRCALETGKNPKTDILDQIMSMEFSLIQ